MGNSPDSPPDSDKAYTERRTIPRYHFSATTEVTDSANAAKLTGRVTEISRKGCYVDILNALPEGTLVTVRITCDHGALAIKGKILYVHEGIGMGVIFLNPPEDQLKTLDSWLAELPPAATP